MIYELKHFDTPLIRFSLESEGLKGVTCKILWIDKKKTALFPIGMGDGNEGLLSWLRSRAVPKNRGYIEAILSAA